MSKKIKIISSLQDFKSVLEESHVKIFGIGGTPIVRSEFWSLLPSFELICANKTGEAKSAEEKIRITYFEKTKSPVPFPVRKPEALLGEKKVVDHIQKDRANKKIAIVIFSPNSQVELACKKNNWKLIANSTKLFQKISDKRFFHKLLTEISFPSVGIFMKLSALEKNLDALFEKFDGKIVIQLTREGGGKGTFFFTKNERASVLATINERLPMKEGRELNPVLLINKFFTGPSLSITGCITKENGILSSYAQYQLIDIPESTSGKKDASGIFCGHDWTLSNAIPLKIHREAERLLIQIGLNLQKKGALGVFGLDFIWEKETGKVIPIEINPRLLGTFPTSVSIQLEKGEVPLAAFHVLEFLNIPYKIKNTTVFKKTLPRYGAHLLLFNPLPFTVKCGKELQGGVYKITKGHLVFQRLGLGIEDIRHPEEFIITDGVPTKKLAFAKNRKLLKIITREAISTNDGKELLPWGKKIVALVYAELALKKF
jgi:predicted ATP-grasp superfamily ATP-dependent carboligase